jgi:hypothetical protein
MKLSFSSSIFICILAFFLFFTQSDVLAICILGCRILSLKFFREEGNYLEQFDPTKAKYDYKFSNENFSNMDQDFMPASQDLFNSQIVDIPEIPEE